MNSINSSVNKIGLAVAFAALSVAAGLRPASAAVVTPLNLPKPPLFLNAAVDPNIAITLDDSGSMESAFMPDTVDDACSYRHPKFYYSGFNRVYFNPAIRYTPPLNPDGSQFPNATFSSAWMDGYEGQPTTTVAGAAGARSINLSTEYFPSIIMNDRTANGAGTRVGHGASHGSVNAHVNCTNTTGVYTGADEFLPTANVTMVLADIAPSELTITATPSVGAGANGIGVTGGASNEQINNGETLVIDFVAKGFHPTGVQRVQFDFNNTGGTDSTQMLVYGADGTTLIQTLDIADTGDTTLGNLNVGRVTIRATNAGNLNLRRIRYREDLSMFLPFASNSTFVGINRFPNEVTSAAFYARFTGSNPADATQVADAANYTYVNVANESAADQQNFANWYSYYRTRYLMARSALSRVFGVQDTGLRVIWQNLDPNDDDDEGDGVRGPGLRIRPGSDPMVQFSGTGRNNFFQWLYRAPASGSTPNRRAMLRAGELFRSGASGTTNLTNPYYEPAPLNRELTCRQNFHIHLTDGFTNETSNPALNAALTARPDTAMTLPDGKAFTPSSQPTSAVVWDADAPPTNGGCEIDNPDPTPDTPVPCAPSLADIAFAYWATDLRTDLTNNVPTYVPDRTRGITAAVPATPVPNNPIDDPEIYWNPANDSATWQHMVNFTVGLGVAGERVFPTDTNALRISSDAIRWPGLTNLQPPAIDDLWRAGLVSRGGYFSAGDPSELVDSLSATLNAVVVRRGTASAATVTSGIIQASTLAFRTQFDSGDWSGQVTAFNVDDRGRLTTPVWEAGLVLNSRDLASNDRQILTSGVPGGDGIAFRWSSLPTAFQDALNDNPATVAVDNDGQGEDRVAYIRGDRTLELDQGGPFRIRASRLGAVINSGAVVVAAPSASYDDDAFPAGSPEATAAGATPAQGYAQFRTANLGRRRVIYVGGNDGMLHAFDAGTGVTTFDGAGNPVTDPGTGAELWAYIPYEVRKSLSTLTNPNFVFNPFVDASPTVRDVFIGGQWRTLLVGSLRRGGQGIFAIDVTNPAVTEANAATAVLWEFSDENSDNRALQMGYTYGKPNITRLANNKWNVVVPAAYNNDEADGFVGNGNSSLFVLDAADGSIIKEFRLTGSKGLTTPTMGDYEDDSIDEFAVAGDLNGALWRFDMSDPDPTNWVAEKMFVPAVDGNQPITSAPRLFAEPVTGGIIAVFGTGKYLEPVDRGTSIPTQSLYGVREYGKASASYPIARSSLVQQTLTRTSGIFSVTSNQIPAANNGWYLDFLDAGERDVTSAGALFSSGLAIFSSIIPNGDDPCLPGLRGNIYVLNAASGGAPNLGPIVDTNNDGVVNNSDNANAVGTAVSSAVAEGSPAVLVNVGGGPGSLPDFPGIQVPDTVWRRRSWREIQQ
jgi:type IV pilus assembly protein PilY1